MDFTIRLTKIKSIDQIAGYWTHQDYIQLLELLDFPDASSLPENEVVDMLMMAISDFEPKEAAAIVLKYKLGDHLNDGQIENIAHEMLLDKIAEEYSDIALHYPLYNINQLLFKAYNGKFPNTTASMVDLEITTGRKLIITREIVLRMLSDLLSPRSLVKRLFEEQLDSDEELKDANAVIWELKHLGDSQHQVITSDYWLSREDFESDEYSGTLSDEEISHD